jgi:UDP-N-acetylglucosamine 2-epimerase (non-hydrolysing)
MAKSYAVVVGTRPNFVKAAAFLAGAKEYSDLSCTLIHTGQHFDDNMSKVFFEEMDISKPDIHLSLAEGTSSEQQGSMINALTREFISPTSSYDGVIVFGDVNSSLAGALAASSARLSLVHVEAGLRSHDKRMPEETNRIIIDHLAGSRMISEESARKNLEREGILLNIHAVGSLMIESLERFKERALQHSVREKIGLPEGYVVATIHRSENLAEKALIENILRMLAQVRRHHPVVFPMHPGTRARIKEWQLDSYLESITIVEPLGYLEFLDLMLNSKGCITDSGGIQEETSHLGIPCCTLRDNTERPVTIELGSNKLFPPTTLDEAALVEMEAHLARTDFMPGVIPLWDTHVSERIVQRLI